MLHDLREASPPSGVLFTAFWGFGGGGFLLHDLREALPPSGVLFTVFWGFGGGGFLLHDLREALPPSGVLFTVFWGIREWWVFAGRPSGRPSAVPYGVMPSTRFFMSMAVVTGPTPPGTGVMAEATSLTEWKSTSPASL